MNDLSASPTRVKTDVGGHATLPTIHLASADGTSLRLNAAWMHRLLPDEDINQISARLAGAGEWRGGTFHSKEPAMLVWLFDFLAARVRRPWGRA